MSNVKNKQVLAMERSYRRSELYRLRIPVHNKMTFVKWCQSWGVFNVTGDYRYHSIKTGEAKTIEELWPMFAEERKLILE